MSVGQQGGDRVKRPGASGDDWGALREDVGGIAEAAVSAGPQIIHLAKITQRITRTSGKPTLLNRLRIWQRHFGNPRARLKNDPTSRRLSTALAEGLDQLAGSIRERSFAEIFSDMETMVRRRPATFGVAAVAVGFVAARFIKSTSEDLRQAQSSSDETFTGRSTSGRPGV